MQSLADLWGKSGKAFATAQQGLFSGMADTMAKAAGAGDTASFQAFAPDTQGFEAARQDFSKLWSSASELSSALTKNLQGADQANPLMTEMLAKIFDPRGWFSATNEVDQTLQRMAEGPRLADLWNVERKFVAVFNAWVAMRRHSLEHNTVMLEAWMKAAGVFAKTLNERAEQGETLESSREVLALWVETANEVLARDAAVGGFSEDPARSPEGLNRPAPSAAGAGRVLQRDVRLPDPHRTRRRSQDRHGTAPRAAGVQA